jgi:hypothetical protein
MKITKPVCILALMMFAANSFAQAKKTEIRTEVLQYVSATYDPISEETQVEFKNANNEKRVFYYNKQDIRKLEEDFFNPPVNPITEPGKNLTKTELVGKNYKVDYFALTEFATTSCCFKIRSYAEVIK